MMEIIRIDLNGVNCYLGKQDGNFVLFDTGGHTVMDKQFDNRYDSLLKHLNEYGCTPENMKLIVLTHGDIDHAANASALRKHFGMKIALHEGDRALVENPDIKMVMRSFNFRSVFYKIAMLFIKGLVRKVTAQMLDDYERFTPDVFLADGDRLDEYGFDAQILHTPGHTPGSIAILTSNGDLIIGDTMTNNVKPDIAINAFEFKLLRKSVERLKKLDIKTVFPGHGEPFQFPT